MLNVWRIISVSFSYFLGAIYFKAWINNQAFTSMTQQPLVDQGLLIIEALWPHSLDTPFSVGLLWTNDQPDIETATWQHKTFTTDRHLRLSGIRNYNLSRRVQAKPRLRPRSHRDRQHVHIGYICTEIHETFFELRKDLFTEFLCLAHWVLFPLLYSNGRIV
jgi:hypothetical protein